MLSARIVFGNKAECIIEQNALSKRDWAMKI